MLGQVFTHANTIQRTTVVKWNKLTRKWGHVLMKANKMQHTGTIKLNNPTGN
jgi:hypothetical protein